MNGLERQMMQLYLPVFVFACSSVTAACVISQDNELGPVIYGTWITLSLWLTVAVTANLI